MLTCLLMVSAISGGIWSRHAWPTDNLSSSLWRWKTQG